MLHHKRTIIAAGGALTVAFALTGCGQAGYGPNNTAELRPAGAQPAAPAKEAAAKPAAPAKRAAKPARNVTGKVTKELISKNVPRMGNVVTDAKGWVLYRFDDDSAKPPVTNCAGDCAKVWPPLLTEDGETPQLTGISAAKVGTVDREDGSTQVTIGGWPVYRYLGDTKPGTWKGQAVGGKWFVVDKNGKRNKTCLPEETPKAVKPPADDEDAESESESDTETESYADSGSDAAAESGGDDDSGEGGY